MPYVEGFGTWPFGEEWLWEALASCYLPLLDLLDRDVPLTISLTPVLCDQFEADGIATRFTRFVEQVRRSTHEEDAQGLRAGGHQQLARELERSLGEYLAAVAKMSRRGDMLGAFAPHAQWTSSATHAVLPLLASEAGLRAQVQTGIDSHRARFGEGWQGGFWLPECAHCPAIEPALLDAGVRSCCVELTSRYGLGAREHLRPLSSGSGITLIPIDRQVISLVWSDQGYPSHPEYRDSHRRTVHHHNPWNNAGDAYDHEAAAARAARDAADFVARVRERLSQARQHAGSPLPGGGLVVCALDTELLGHWWYEGLIWLDAVIEECSRQGLALVRLDQALERCEPAPVDTDQWPESSWGVGGGLSTWSGPMAAEIAFAQRAAELRLLRRGHFGDATLALRELMAMQSSDWAFMVSERKASDYARKRFAGHSAAFERALSGDAQADAMRGRLRNLASHASPALLALA
jgi:1,4-alpha-glucan branching enzyme